MGKFAKNYGKVVGKDSQDRPGWKGPGYIKKTEATATKAKKTTEETVDDVLQPVLPIELQQLLLNTFKNAFPKVLDSDDLKFVLQDVKGALYERDFNRAFGKESYLEAYSVRWSPSRALCYASILADLRNHLVEIFPLCAVGQDQGKGNEALARFASTLSPTLHVVCFGGGAAEVVGFAGFLHFLHAPMLHTASASKSTKEASIIAQELASLSFSNQAAEINLLLVDTAAWGNVVHKLHHELTNPPPLSKYASSSAKEVNSALLERGSISVRFRAEDILELSQVQIKEIVGQTPTLVTLMFTLNELYTTSIGKTTAFLLNLTTAVSPGTLLLVVDSSGSYSETSIGTGAKKYPMLWLLNHTLLNSKDSEGKESVANWSKVISDESKWFRLHENLRYPINLENMRYQLHLYKRT